MKEECNWEEDLQRLANEYIDYEDRANFILDMTLLIAQTLEQQKAEEQTYYSDKLKEQKEFITNQVKQSLIEKFEHTLKNTYFFGDPKQFVDDIIQSLKEEDKG